MPSVLRIIFFTVLFSLPAVAKEYVLIGDSHSCGSFGVYMLGKFKERGDKMTIYCAPSSSPFNWLNGDTPAGHIVRKATTDDVNCDSSGACRTVCRPGVNCKGEFPKFRSGKIPKGIVDEIAKAYPNAVKIVALGTNSLPGTNTADSTYAELAGKVKGSKGCLWVGPPYFNIPQTKGYKTGTMNANLPEFYKSLYSNVNSICAVQDSRPITKKCAGAAKTCNNWQDGHDTGDGVHRSEKGGKAWANATAGKINITAAPVRPTPKPAAPPVVAKPGPVPVSPIERPIVTGTKNSITIQLDPPTPPSPKIKATAPPVAEEAPKSKRKLAAPFSWQTESAK